MKFLKKTTMLFMAMVMLSLSLITVARDINANADQSKISNFNTNYTLTDDGATNMINIACAQIDKTGKELGYGEPWCANFVVDCARLANETDAIPTKNGYASCRNLKQYIIAAGGKDVTYEKIMPGDIVFFDGHVEIVYSGSLKALYSIGGNTGSGSNYSTRKVCSPRIHGSPLLVLRPNYTGEYITSNDDTLSIPYPRPTGTPNLKSGSTGSDVCWLQTALNIHMNAGLNVDGKFGNGTQTAVINFQNLYGLEVDGIAGPSTINKLVECLENKITPTQSINLYVTPGSELQQTYFKWDNISTAIKYGIRIYESDNWDNQVYANWNHMGNEDLILLQPGNYMGQCMYQTSEGGDWIFSNMVYFEIIKSGLLIPYINTEKSEYAVGDEINISWSASPSDSQLSHYWLVITSPDGKEIVGETMNLNTSFSFTVEQIGNYTIKTFATPFNSKEGEGSLTDTKTISVIAVSTTSTTTMTTSTTTSTTTTTTTSTTTSTMTTTSTTMSTSTTTTTTTTTSTTTSTTTTTIPPTTTEPAYLLGDVNEDGSVDSSDASLVLAEYAKIQTGGAGEFTDIQYKSADVNKDDVVDSSDASKILAYYAAISTGQKPTWD